MVSRYWFESLAGIPCDVEVASRFRYRKSAVRRNNPDDYPVTVWRNRRYRLALRLSKELGCWALWQFVTCRDLRWCVESDLLMTNAGTEIVASTKRYHQLTVLLMLVAKLARLKGLDASIEHDIVHGLQALPEPY